MIGRVEESRHNPMPGKLTQRKKRLVGNYYELLLQGLALGLAASVSPGPFQAYLINQALANGFRGAAPVAFAPLIADIPIVAASLLLLDQLSPEFLRFIHIAGGLFVLYMAYSLWRSWRANASLTNSEVTEAPPATLKSSLGRGVVMNLFSPGPYTFWFLVSGPILVSALRESTGEWAGVPAGFLCSLDRRLLRHCSLIPPGAPLGAEGCAGIEPWPAS